MRVIQKPNISPIDTYVACYSSCRSQSQVKYHGISRFIDCSAYIYDSRAVEGDLYKFKPHIRVRGDVSKEDMVKLYDNKMVGHQTGRKIYDKLILLAPLGICPFCGFGHVKTLDHYLPKSEFPTFSVLPYNLVPCCRDCNTDKLASYATTITEQTLHPYYDDFTDEQWLFARVLQTSPVSIEYYVNPPASWSTIDKDRVSSHFNNYGLAKRFAIEASNPFAILNSKFIQYATQSHNIKSQLKEVYEASKSLHLNSWETAIYQALYQDQWYCDGGYNN